MRKKPRKILSLVLTIVMLASPSVQSLAAPIGPGEEILENESEINLSTEAHLVKAGDYFTAKTAFKEQTRSNAVVLNFSFDGDLFEYANYTPATDVTVVSTEHGDGFAKINLMVPNYNAENLGDTMLRAKEDAKLTNATHILNLSADYVVKNQVDSKEIKTANTSTSFTTRGDGSDGPAVLGDTNDDGIVDLIDFSNMIDWFGFDKSYPDWDTLYTFFDLNNNGEIDINDISYVEQLIE